MTISVQSRPEKTDLSSLSWSQVLPRDKDIIVAFHMMARVASDRHLLPDYTLAATKPSVYDGVSYSSYYEKIWTDHFSQRATNQQVRAYKVQDQSGAILGFVRFGLIETSGDATLDTAFGPNRWSELHQLYLSPQAKGRGIGRSLFAQAADELTHMGSDKMLINVLENNANARGFYDYMGATFSHVVIEHNRRNDVVYTVPSALYVKHLGMG